MTNSQERAITLALNILHVGFFECPRQVMPAYQSAVATRGIPPTTRNCVPSTHVAATVVKNPTPRPWLVRSASTAAGWRATRSAVRTHSVP